jgi:broad specificity phosphatase PhoE
MESTHTLKSKIYYIFTMTKLLATLNWSGPTLNLLKHMKNLNPDKPAILHIRHTERINFTQEELHGTGDFSGYNLFSTDVGKQAAYDFGTSLPTNREYTIFHTPIDRTLETAESICQGIKSMGGKAMIAGKMSDLPILDQKARGELSRRRVLRYGIDAFPDGGAINWICGFNPPNLLKSSLEFAQELARTNMNNLRNAPSNALHVYVSHDMWVLTLMFHWFAVLPHPDGLPFLDGFLMQMNTDELQAWFRDKNRLYECPYWWPKT